MTRSETNEVRIEVDGYTPRQVFYPGQRVTGRVVYDIRKEDDEIRDVTIQFEGFNQTDIVIYNGQYNFRYAERIVLFSYTTSLFSGQFTTNAQTLSWPYEFRFPNSVTYDRSPEPSDSSFTNSKLVPLPPSCAKVGRDSTCVTYGLVVRINASRASKYYKTWRLLPLRQLPPSPPLPQLTGRVSFGKHEWRSRKLRNHKHTFSEKMKHVFTSDKTLRNPTISFDAVMQLPTQISATQRCDLLLSLTQTRTGPTDPESPRLVLGDIDIWLLGETSVRVKAFNLHGGVIGSMHSLIRDKETWSLLQAPQVPPAERVALDIDGKPRLIAKDWALADADGVYAALEQPRVPDFTTWTAAHRHLLRVRATLTHPETGHKWKLRGQIPIVITPDIVQVPEDVDQGQQPAVASNDN